MAFVDPRALYGKFYGAQQPTQVAGGLIPDFDPTGKQDAAGVGTPAPPVKGAAPTPGGGKALVGDLYKRFMDALGGLGFQQYHERPDELIPAGDPSRDFDYWAKVGRGGADWAAGQGAWAVPWQFEGFYKDGGFDLQDYSKDTNDAQEWLNFLQLYGAKMDPGLVADLRKWLG